MSTYELRRLEERIESLELDIDRLRRQIEKHEGSEHLTYSDIDDWQSKRMRKKNEQGKEAL